MALAKASHAVIAPLPARCPLIFTFLWSSGWIVAGYSAQYADALTFLALRFATAGVLLAACRSPSAHPGRRRHAPGSTARSPASAARDLSLRRLVGGPPWSAAGISGLIAGLQPILTALLAPALVGERISLVRWAGIAFGFVGIALVLEPKLVGVDPTPLGGI